jgi:CheY-like chemotaxis protein
MSRAAAQRAQGATKNGHAPQAAAAADVQKKPVAQEPAETPAGLAAHPPSATLPPTPARLLHASDQHAAAEEAQRADAATAVAERPPAPARAPGPPVASPDSIQDTLEVILAEIRSMREAQERLLQQFERSASLPAPAVRHESDAATAEHDDDGGGPPVIRARRRKTVLLIDDDKRTREAAISELRQADVPVRAYDEGNAALSGIAEEKPDVIVLELGLGGDMAGKDVINMIKATMEWVDVPIVLWTRETVSNQREARQIHGADEIVPKSAGAAALVARVVTVFRRG